MKDKKTLITIIILLVVFLPLGLVGTIKHFSTSKTNVDVNSNPNKEFIYNGKVYFTVEADSKANLISIDVETGEINEVVSLVESNKTVRTYTEIAVCADGFYYTNPSNTDGGLFYHAFNQTEEIKICTD